MLFPLFVLGIRWGSQLPVSCWVLPAVFCVLTTVWMVVAYRGWVVQRRLFPLVLALGAFTLGQLSALSEQVWADPQQGEFQGKVYSIRRLTFDQRVLVRLNWRSAQVAVHLPLEVPVEIGDELIFSGTITRPPKAPNPGVFCYRSYLRRLGVFGVSYPEQFSVVGGKLNLLERVRGFLRRNIIDQVHDPGVVLALVLGERDQLGAERQETWRKLGISHLLAISGMHVGYVALGFGFLLQRIPWRPWIKYICVQGGLLGFLMVAGTGASSWRAFLMSAVGGYGALRGLRRDGLGLWAVAGMALLFYKPSLAFDLGFLLSFAASGGILLWAPLVRVRFGNRVLTFVVQGLLVSTVAQLTLVPFLLAAFGEVALLGPLATLLFVPLVVILVIGGILTAVGLGSLGLGRLLNGVMAVVAALERLLLPQACLWRLGVVTMSEVWVWWLFFLYCGWCLRRPRLTPPKRTVAQLVTGLTVLLFLSTLPPAVRRPLEVTALNVGHGGSYFLRTPSGRSILIDGGGDLTPWQQQTRDAGKERVLPYLEHRQVERLDYVILTHPHDDHLLGLLAVLEALEVCLVLDNGHQQPTPTYERYLDLLAERNIPYSVLRAGDHLHLGDGITLTVLYPREVRPHLPSPQNNNSLLIQVEYGGLRLLFTGDLEAPVLYDLAHDHRLDLKAQWLTVPHHGSRGSLVEEFYQAVDPRWAVISVGPNRFGHPHPEVVALLEERNVVWKTTQDGPQTFEVWWGVWGRFKPSEP